MYEQFIRVITRETGAELEQSMNDFLHENPRPYIDNLCIIDGTKFTAVIVYHI